ncbi:MAG: serine O-acetyltransferase [Chromatiales bacterium]|jgi:serine O-acetyltransferase|nr:serine O-acetyltransferase [Chromatiales bacterium]
MFERIREDVRCVFERDPAARTTLEVLTTYPGVHALVLYRLSHRLWHAGLKWPARMVSMFSRWLTGIEIHPAAEIGRRFFIDHGMGVVIGETAQVGDDCTLYHGVTLGGTTWNKGKRHPTLGNNVIIGAGAKVLGPLQIGDGVRIGSNAVVTKDVQPGATMVGVPAHATRRAVKPDERQRKAFAEKIGFDAYATAQDMPDPVVQSVNALLDHVRSLESHIAVMARELEKLGGHCDLPPVPEATGYEIEPCAERASAGDEGEGKKL